MRKPISKHALRRAMERVRKDGLMTWEHPTGTVVDRIWHEIEKASYRASRKKPVSRETIRETAAVEVLEG